VIAFSVPCIHVNGLLSSDEREVCLFTQRSVLNVVHFDRA